MADPDINLSNIPMAPPVVVPAVSPDYVAVVEPLKPAQALSFDDHQTLQVEQGFPAGLIQQVVDSRLNFPWRFWVVDNSGSMQSTDGHRLVGQRNNLRVVPCNRWKELQDTVEYHLQLAALLRVSTTFRLLNDPVGAVLQQEFSVGSNNSTTSSDADVAMALHTIQNAQPTGVTPLTQHVHEITARIRSLQEVGQLPAGTRTVVVLATDGLPSDAAGHSTAQTQAEFLAALQQLQTLPVWTVVRLCTDDDSVVDYYNELDSVLESPLEVLDDFLGEAKEVHQHNPWLNYGLPLHRVREMGYHEKTCDLLDERILTKDEFFDFCKLLFGRTAFSSSDIIYADWKAFTKELSQVMQDNSQQWNPITRKVEPWLDMKKVQKHYGEKKGWFGRR